MDEKDKFLLTQKGARASMINQQVSADKPSISSDGTGEPPEPAWGDPGMADGLNAQAQPEEAPVNQTEVGIQVGIKDGQVALVVTTTAGQVLASLTVDQARSMAANLAHVCDTLTPTQATIFVVTEKMSWTLPNQALSFRYDLNARNWQHAWAVQHKVVPKGQGNGKAELKRGSALILPPGMRS